MNVVGTSSSSSSDGSINGAGLTGVGALTTGSGTASITGSCGRSVDSSGSVTTMEIIGLGCSVLGVDKSSSNSCEGSGVLSSCTSSESSGVKVMVMPATSPNLKVSSGSSSLFSSDVSSSSSSD